jgi:hypothetical protein
VEGLPEPGSGGRGGWGASGYGVQDADGEEE